MNILIVEDIASTTWGGAEKSMFSYIRHLKEKNHNIYLTYQRSGDWLNIENSHYFEDIISLDISSFKVQGINSYIKNIIIYISFVKRNNINIIFTHTIHGFLFLKIASYFINIPIAVYFRWIYSYDSIGTVNKWAVSCISRAASQTKHVKDYWQKNNVTPQYGFRIIPNGITFDEKKVISINIHKKINKLLYIGRLYEGKGVHLIIESLKFHKDLSLKICGDYKNSEEAINYYQKLKKLINKYKLEKRVSFLGFCSNTLLEMNKSDLVIVPSIVKESQSRVILESMAHKTLVIASNTGGTPNILGNDAKDLLFEPNISSLIEKLKYITNMPANKKEEKVNMLFYRFINNYTENIQHNNLDNFLELK